MRYRKEDDSGDYTFGQGGNTFLTDTPEAVAQAVKTRFALWTGEWFLDVTEGTPYREAILGKHKSDAYNMAVRQRILGTPGVTEILEFTTEYNAGTRSVVFTATINTLYGETTVTSEA
ncbi:MULTISPECIES: hypothetical protein [unclassified Serratia (in: enterobacteria)]|uniref:hypothetical protein n=1 Tax=unclassified Serratia (in: enterobacteria) TaxID=2647522 RepID=UPI0005065C66|nr:MULTISPECIES: hypothetical protein [unclassified Serratia (in: enterobacteria)]KFK92011.1 bacteriophage protein [Serratia sp. Ag2]KFK98412.1 bacteriophage protein [Serratia sp. Ag1]